MNRLRKKLSRLLRRRQLDRDLQDELDFHLQMKAEMLEDNAAARRQIGNIIAIQESCRELWTFARVESWWQDICYGVRMLAKTPAFTLIAVIALALGIGADTAIFTIANGAFSWNLGLDHVDRVILVGLADASHRQEFGVSYPDFREIRSRTKSLAGLAAYQFASVNLTDTKTFPERYHCAKMSANGFLVSEQKPILGRGFMPEDEKPGAPPVAVLTFKIWQGRYGGDPAIIGKTIHVNDVPTTIVGVMPAGRRFPEDIDLWTPLVPNASLEQRDNRDLVLFGRLADGVTPVAAQTELSAIAAGLGKQYPSTNGNLIAEVQSIVRITGAYGARPFLAALWVAVGFVFLIACADVANMLLGRGTGRMREISIRTALGASRTRIVRQLLIESVLLSFGGGFFGWLVALGGLRWFDSVSGSVKPPWLNLSFDRTAFIYLTAISVTAGILFGIAPALRLANIDVHTAIKDGALGTTGGRRGLSIANLLVMIETTLCLILLVGAGLMIHSAVKLYDAPVGVNTSNVLTMRVNLPEAKYPAPGDLLDFHRTLQTKLDALAGVESTAIVSNLPLGGYSRVAYELSGSPPEPGRAPLSGAIVASPAYFHVMQVTPQRGRAFTAADGTAGPPVVMVNESFARTFWPNEEPIGKRLRLAKGSLPQPWLTVVGVIPDVLQNFQRPLERDPLIYLPYAEEPAREMFLLSRTSVPPNTLADAFRRTIQSLDNHLPVYEVRTLQGSLDRHRFSASLLEGVFSIFAGVALVLAVLGIYAVIAHSISERTQEIGVRLAIGGTRRNILTLVYLQGMRPLALGIACGLPAAFGIAHVLRRLLIGVSPGDPITFLSVILILMLAGIAGCAVPAYRAIRVDPVVALRYE
jgi:predicted permease